MSDIKASLGFVNFNEAALLFNEPLCWLSELISLSTQQTDFWPFLFFFGTFARVLRIAEHREPKRI